MSARIFQQRFVLRTIAGRAGRDPAPTQRHMSMVMDSQWRLLSQERELAMTPLERRGARFLALLAFAAAVAVILALLGYR
jgi:hypothetical protein